MKETDSRTPYVFSISDGKTIQYLDRYESIDFEQQLKDHPWSPVTETQAPRKKQKKKSSILYYTKKIAVSSTITSSSSEKVVKSNSSRGRRIIVDDEESPQATPSGNDTSSKPI